MKRLFPWLALSLFSGCGGYAFEDYETDMSTAMCTQLQDCGYLELYAQTYDECTASYITGVECETYADSSAEECVAAIEAASCEDLVAGVGLSVCEAVCP